MLYGADCNFVFTNASMSAATVPSLQLTVGIPIGGFTFPVKSTVPSVEIPTINTPIAPVPTVTIRGDLAHRENSHIALHPLRVCFPFLPAFLVLGRAGTAVFFPGCRSAGHTRVHSSHVPTGHGRRAFVKFLRHYAML